MKAEMAIFSYHFKDDGKFPNSKHPLLLYKNAFSQRDEKAADWLEKKFEENNWSNAWRWGVYNYHHYHSNTHEVLAVFSGWALLHMGGDKGEKLKLEAGDAIVIPAGVSHKCIEEGENFTVVGAYPEGKEPDMKKGKETERPEADLNIAKVPIPATDPFMGEAGGLLKLW